MEAAAVLFDLDGTLVRTLPELRYGIAGKTLAALGCAAANGAIDRFWFGTNRDRFIQEVFGVEPEAFWQEFRRHDTPQTRARYTTPYADVGVLAFLRARGLRLGLVTGAPPHIAEYEIGLLGARVFDAVVIAQPSQGVAEKPAPDGLERCLELLEVGQQQALYVGNAEEDYLAGRNARLRTLIVDRGECPLTAIPASRIIPDLYAVQGLL